MTSEEAQIGEWRERIREAAARAGALRLKGSGSKDFYGESLAGEVLELGAHRGILDYEPSELVVRARCGTRLSELNLTLAREGQFLAFEPPAFGSDPTLGGMIAAGLSGPRRAYAGAARDFVLGTRLLDARGQLLHFGGEVMKNVAGFDVSRLLCGSLGILGIITEVSLKVLPLPRHELTLRLELPEAEALETFSRLAAQPLPLSGAAWAGGAAWLRLSGAASAVSAARTRIGGEAVDEHPARSFWQQLRDLALPALAGNSLWRLSVPATAAVLRLPGEACLDWGGSLRWYAGVPPGTDVRAAAVAAGGTALHWRGEAAPGTRFHPLPGVTRELHRRLKERFDPQGVFNPGRLLSGL